MEELASALRLREQRYRESLDVVLQSSEDNMEPELHDAYVTLREAVELARRLRGALASETKGRVHDILGAPGDWGYETDLGNALAEYYRRP